MQYQYTKCIKVTNHEQKKIIERYILLKQVKDGVEPDMLLTAP